MKKITRKDILIFETKDREREIYRLYQIPESCTEIKNIGEIFPKTINDKVVYGLNLYNSYLLHLEDIKKIYEFMKTLEKKNGNSE